ncbi:MAG: FMN-binding negative transcriptional regulator [Bdellovibrionales bacterium]|nr:FMN-binding negative transcriptional regulator [Bdellovibrionales bacterium]
MYLPSHFSTTDLSHTLALMQKYPFATLISFDKAGAPIINHFPLLTELVEGKITIVGHMAKRNPQWRNFASHPRAVVVFSGPHTYITPSWYVSGRDVPTWNYAVAHVEGTVRLVEDFAALTALLQRLTQQFEHGSSSPWQFELPEDLQQPEALTSAIVGFEIQVDKIETKFKLSQNRSVDDRRGILAGLATRTDDLSKQVLAMMNQELEADAVVPEPI